MTIKRGIILKILNLFEEKLILAGLCQTGSG